jgi:hypothetical protein
VLRAPSQPTRYRVRTSTAPPVASRPRNDAGRLVEGVDLDATTHHDPVQCLGPGVEPRFEGRLVEHRRGRPAGRASADPAVAQKRPAGPVAPLVDVAGLADRRQVRTDTARLEDAADLVVEVHRPRQRVRLRPPLRHDDPPAELGEEDRQGGADRSVSDDGDVGVDVITSQLVGTHGPQATGRSGSRAAEA